MGKLISNKELAQHIYPVLEMLNNNIKRLKMKKIEFEISGKKIPEIRHLPANHPDAPFLAFIIDTFFIVR